MRELHYDKKASCKESEKIEVGDDVYVLDMQRKKRKGGSLQKTFKGPYTVFNVTATGNFKLESDGKILEGSHGRKLLKKVKGN